MDYHGANPHKIAMDVGTGSGFVAFKLLEYFDKVVGTDLSETMAGEAQKNAVPSQNIEFLVAPAEESPNVIAPNSLDLVTAAECVHWMDHPKFFAETHRVLAKGGTLAFWFYKDPIFVGYPKANEIYNKYCYNDERYMGPKWQQPGRNFLRTLMAEVPVPEELFENIVRNEYDPEKDEKTKTELIISKRVNMAGLKDYVSSWSAYHSWKIASENAGKEDVADLFIRELKEAMGWDDTFEFEISFSTAYTFATKK
ncbi:hypothetical protein BABINDRAFT_162159 [Babjeviella inositovora NRRL Y-12698]|uniref:Methyltransferase type 11 domain-containing protein n=1 Tax=Babjeviella inositovora NRRL Y-12698 TaxID=984486 RepID=A0A1E3QNS7_9ASCO|nr:uncharacterized protein BABINDRAFT_162159 [Babjeviella inositovora NRRL Y-12698]ODQ79094.1 hypothetical protein BABINDRAFT_162159 [Babjeviella inositovora NRRL Y-12698]